MNPEKSNYDLSAQEIFDRVLTHLRKQRQPSVAWHNPTGRLMCAYRGVFGQKCAAGVLIPDAVYSPEMDRRGLSKSSSEGGPNSKHAIKGSWRTASPPMTS